MITLEAIYDNCWEMASAWLHLHIPSVSFIIWTNKAICAIHNFLNGCPVSSQSHNFQIWRRKKDGAIFMVCIGQTFWYRDLLSPLILMRSDQPYDLSGNDEGPALFWTFRFLFLNSVSPCIFLSPISFISWCWDDEILEIDIPLKRYEARLLLYLYFVFKKSGKIKWTRCVAEAEGEIKKLVREAFRIKK